MDIVVTEDLDADLLTIEITDNGVGMESDLLDKVLDPFVTTRTTRRVGLGLSAFDQAARMAGGSVTIESKPGEGTRVRATFQHSHIDRKPMGDLRETLETLVVGHPEIDLRFRHHLDDGTLELDTRGHGSSTEE